MQPILKQVKKIEIKTKRLVEGVLQGSYHSIFKGSGIEFSDVREYQEGDDVRVIDWNITARMNKPFVKEYIEERDNTFYFLFDVSSSNEFGSTVAKKDRATEVLASLMFAAQKNGDRVGVVCFSDQIEHFIPARKGRRHILRILAFLLQFTPQAKGTNISVVLEFIAKILKKRGVLFIISDFLSPDFSKALRIARNKHEIIAINLHDIREQEIPDIGFIELEDEETGEQLLVDTSDEGFRKEYTKLVKQQNDALKKTLKKSKVDLIQLNTDQSYFIPLKSFFARRIR